MTPRLSVVVACTRVGSAADAAWLAALAHSCAGIDAELVLVGAEPLPGAASADSALPGRPRIVHVPLAAGALVPVHWGQGLRAARGDVVAFTTDRCRVHASWARAALDAITGGAAAVGGPLRLADAASATDRAIYQLRFGGLPTAGEIAVHDVAADNAAYDRRLLCALGLSYDDGFWEVEANRRLRAGGYALVFHAGMAAEYDAGEALWPLARQRFVHGQHAGAWRVAIGVRRRWQIALAAPVVPLVLLERARRRLPARRLAPLARATPAFLVLASAWAAGEAVGALRVSRAAVSGA